MMIPALSPTSSLYSSQQYENKLGSESEDKKSTLAGSFNNYCRQLYGSVASSNNQRLFASAVTTPLSSKCDIDQSCLKHFCMRHRKKFAYTCLTCIESVCSQCLHDPTQHRNHRFQRYNQKKEDLRIIRKELGAQINQRKDEINKFIELQQKQKADKIQTGTKDVEKLEGYLKRLVSSVDESVSLSENECGNYKTILKQFHQFYDLSLAQLLSTNRVSLLGSTGCRMNENFAFKISEIQKINISVSNSGANIMTKPLFFSNVFRLSSFSKVKEAGQDTIFQPFQAYQSFWRLKVYPSGYSGVRVDEKHAGVQYMSIYAERIDGVLDSSTFTIRIEITSRTNSRLKIKKQFQSQFSRNQSWGYDRFTRLSNIYDHGFLGEDDSLFIQVSIRAASYFEASRALTQIANRKQKIQQDNERRIKILKVMLEKRKQAKQNKEIINKNLPYSFASQGSGRKQKKQEEENGDIINNEDSKKVGEIFSNPNHLSKKIKQQIKEKLGDRAGGLGVSRSRQQFPSLSLQKKSPTKLIRLVSLRNMQLIENSKKSLHNRSSSYY